MKILFTCIFLSITINTYALPIGVFVVGYELLVPLFGFILSLIISVFITLRNLPYKFKILLSILLIIITITSYYIYNKKNILNQYREQIGILKTNIDYNRGSYEGNIDGINNNYLFENIGDYHLLDIRELSEYESGRDIDYYIKLNITNIKSAELVKNYNIILSDIDKKVVLICMKGDRSKIISNYLKGLGYNVTFLEGGLKSLGNYNFMNNKNQIPYCVLDENINNELLIGNSNSNISTFNIPYMELTYDDIDLSIDIGMNNNFINKEKILSLSCNYDNFLNCSVGRESMGILLRKKGFKNICLSKNHNY